MIELEIEFFCFFLFEVCFEGRLRERQSMRQKEGGGCGAVVRVFRREFEENQVCVRFRLVSFSVSCGLLCMLICVCACVMYVL